MNSEPGKAEKRAWRYIGGLAGSQFVAGLLYIFTLLFVGWKPASHRLPTWQNPPFDGFYTASATVLIPLLLGMTAAWIWRPLDLPTKKLAWSSLICTLMAIVCGGVIVNEGAICLAMASPLLFGLIFAGVLGGNAVFRSRYGPVRVSVVPLLLLLLVTDTRLPHTHNGVVTTRVRVNATPAQVGKYIVAFPPLDKPSDFWLCRIGLPYPVETTASGATVGSARQCRFSGGITVDERISEVIPGRSVAFDVTRQPRYPEVADHATLHRGRITVEDNGDGTTTLVGTSWYSLHVFPAAYFGPWGDYLIHGVHYRVFDHIKTLAERDARRR